MGVGRLAGPVLSRRARWTIGLFAAQVGLLVATFPLDGLGAETWHHLASLAAVLALAGVLHERFRRSRRFLAIGVAVFSILAAASGFYLLYWKAGIRVDGYQDWGVFWHIVWSWMAAVFFLQHAWINRVQLVHFYRESFATRGTALLHAGAYVVLVAALVVTWSPQGRAWFTNENYVVYSLRTWALAVVPTFAAWLVLRRRLREDPDWLRERLGHWGIRRMGDLLLVPMAALAILSGFPLLFDGPIDPRGLKYVSKFWHVWPSIVFTIVAFVHANQAWSTVKVHWRSYAREEG